MKGQNGFNNNADEKRTAIEAWQNGYVDQKQKVYEDYFTNILNFNGQSGKIEIIKKRTISGVMTEQLMQAVLTKNQIL